MGRKIYTLAALLCTLPLVQSFAQGSVQEQTDEIELGESFLRPLQKRDSVLIADQLDYGFLMKDVVEGTLFGLPQYGKGFCSDSVEIVSLWRLDTLRIVKPGRRGDGRKKFDIEMSVRVTSFEAGSYDLPNLFAQRNAGGLLDTLVFASQHLDVFNVAIDSLTFEPHDIKGQIRYPLTFKEVLPWIIGFVVLAGLIVLAIWMTRRYKRRKEEELLSEPPYMTALRKLDKFRGNKYWAPEKQKVFYTGITDALREYMVSRYEIGAMEMTTAEIFESLKSKDIPVDLYEDSKELFERSDFVKFAKYIVPDEDNAKALPLAVRFVTSTYQLEVEEESVAESPQAAVQEKKEDEDVL